MSDHTSFEIPVVLSEPPHVGTLELWQSADESAHVQWGLSTSNSFDGMGFTPTVAGQLADGLAQALRSFDAAGLVGAEFTARYVPPPSSPNAAGLAGAEFTAEFTVDGVNDDNGEPAWLKASWDTSGLDLIMILEGGERRRIVVDDPENGPIDDIVQALRSCAAALTATQP